MKYLYPVILFILLSPALIYAQSNLKPGYIINLKGDTIKGAVDYREWDQNPDNVNFKLAADAAAKNYTLADIKGFGVAGNAYFVKFELPISYDYVDVTKITSRPTDSTAVHAVFLKVVATGNMANLYSYTDYIKTRYFLEDNTAKQIEELVYHVYYTDGNINFPKKINRYKQQLLVITQNSKIEDERLTRNIQNARYDETDLTNIVQTLNKNKGTSFVAEKLFALRLFAGAAYTRTTVTYSLSFANNTKTTDVVSNNSAPKAAAGIDFVFNKNTNRLFFRLEAAYTQNKYDVLLNNTSFEKDEFHIAQKTVSLSPQIVYSLYSTDNLKAFVAGGVIYNHHSYNNYLLVTQSNGTQTKGQQPYLSFESSAVHFLGRAGVIINQHFELSASYFAPSELSATNGVNYTQKGYQIGINYLF
jgi:hypothetical protein